ncbi:MAG TPA: Hsp20/alpha crystallin family protein [Puia sp.]|nr:Hsp20/alpha crystallin family protein [Puia sp.]
MTTTIVKRQNGNTPVSFGNAVDNLFRNSLRGFFDENFRDAAGQLGSVSVPVNVRETDKQYEIDVIAPGCRKEDFNVQIRDNLLTVSFDHEEENKEQDEKEGWVRNEYIQRSFSRSFTLDDTADVNKINASYADGILHLTLPKNEKAKKVSRNIDIR